MDGQAIRLKYGESETFSPGGGITGVEITKISAKAKNIALSKEVALHYQQANGTWTEKLLVWNQNFGDYDLFSLADNTFNTTTFVLRYSAIGQTFWDNNNGANYQLNSGFPNTVGGSVILNSATAHRGTQAGGGFVFTTSWVEGEIYVKNLSFNKQVAIRLSANNWATFQDTIGSFSGVVPVATGSSQVEVWKFKTPELNLDESTPFFHFVLFYHNLDSGELFWDNNFGQDYTLSKADLALDE
jgi:Carbohydrate/starch-binding module (family 21)